jgi:cytochrome c-type biogenesis protein
MGELNLVFAFTAGIFATVNPCGWAMLPSFVAYYLGSQEESYEERPSARRALEGISLGLLITAGFLAVFGTAGVVISTSLRIVMRFIPLVALLVGALLLLLGIWLLAGKSLPLAIPQPNLDVRARNPRAIFLYGLAYGFASLSCTLPIFLAVVGASLTASGPGGMAVMFAAYAAGMATVLMSVALGAALFKDAVAQWFRRFMPYVHRLGAILLIGAGLYLIWYQGRFLSLALVSF